MGRKIIFTLLISFLLITGFNGCVNSQGNNSNDLPSAGLLSAGNKAATSGPPMPPTVPNATYGVAPPRDAPPVNEILLEMTPASKDSITTMFKKIQKDIDFNLSAPTYIPQLYTLTEVVVINSSYGLAVEAVYTRSRNYIFFTQIDVGNMPPRVGCPPTPPGNVPAILKCTEKSITLQKKIPAKLIYAYNPATSSREVRITWIDEEVWFIVSANISDRVAAAVADSVTPIDK